MVVRALVLTLMALLAAVPVGAQIPSPNQEEELNLSLPTPFELLGLTVEGVADERVSHLVEETSGLRLGQPILRPVDPALADAIRAIYKLELFSNVRIVEDRREGEGVYLIIQVQAVPRLSGYSFSGVRTKQIEKLEKILPLLKGRRVHDGAVEQALRAIETFYREDGYLLASAQVRREATGPEEVHLTFVVERGPRVEIGAIEIAGNEAVSAVRLRRQMKDTKEDRWWRIWKRASFDRAAYQDDLARLLDYYNEKGFYDARILHDTMYVAQEGEPEIVVAVTVHEGPRYHIRSITWEGNSVFSDATLTEALGLQPGDLYNRAKIEENLFGNRRFTDVSSRYMNRGYMRFSAQPAFRPDGDALDLHITLFEGEVYTFGDIAIRGNGVTNDHVIRRELDTIPGQTFSRDAIQHSVRRLMQLGYFSGEELALGPQVLVDEANKEVDLIYSLDEVTKNPIQFSGSFAGGSPIFQLGFTFNNFSLRNLVQGSRWRPLPAGDGQYLSLRAQTSGRSYQHYAIDFAEPWFQGRPNPIGVSASFSRLSDLSDAVDPGRLRTASARFFYDRPLRRGGNTLTLSNSLRYGLYDNDSWSEALPEDLSRELVYSAALTRNTLDHPLFPRQGSRLRLSVDVALPLSGFAQYHKWRLNTNWNVPLGRRFALGFSTDHGYVGSLTGGEVAFERFVVGGSPFDVQGADRLFGRDVVFLRGYPAEAIGPRLGGLPAGGRILNKYSLELSARALQKPQLTVVPYLFLEAANTWDGFSTYAPTELFRSAGAGTRLILPVVGLVEFSYGYNFDRFAPLGSHTGSRGWSFQITFGR